MNTEQKVEAIEKELKETHKARVRIFRRLTKLEDGIEQIIKTQETLDKELQRLHDDTQPDIELDTNSEHEEPDIE